MRMLITVILLLCLATPAYSATLDELFDSLKEFATASREVPSSFLLNNPASQEEFSMALNAGHRAFDHGIGLYIDGSNIPDGIPAFLSSLAKQLRRMVQRSKGLPT